ncbi:MAG: M23 family metallopeptidase [Bacteroidales bacterium]|nr:M23 family metallopeptidase [Bacteroidales bacterium]MBR4213837.1 M23 family metallopeptidase [Bacteroidales bacterium]
MAKEKKQRDNYKIILYNETTLHETTSFRVNMLNIVAYAGVLIIVIALLTALLFVYTPLNSLLPRKDDEKMKWALTDNAMRMDSISRVLTQREEYFAKIKNIMDGRNFEEYDVKEDTTTIERQHADFTKSKHDSIVRTLIEEETQQTLALINASGKEKYKKHNFFMPVHGALTSKFNPEKKHLGIDIAGKEDEPILATLSGTVILATWTIETGNIIQIQHDDNLISIYKHNSVLLKKVGDKVQAGDPIAIIGNSGEFTSGTHLHFEIWHDGVPVNPEDYIIFPQ